jgi:hypothetical protein
VCVCVCVRVCVCVCVCELNTCTGVVSGIRLLLDFCQLVTGGVKCVHLGRMLADL